MISQTTIDEVKARAKCEEVIGAIIALKKQSSNFVANCPFHNEKSASFTVNPKENFYKCFGCGKSGDAISFIMEYQQKSYTEAIETLCSKYNIIMEQEQEYTAKKVYTKPEWKNKTELSERLVKWFEKDRKISQSVLLEAKITEGVEWLPQVQKEVNTVQFNYFRDGELINIKYRDSKKNFKLSKDAELIFYNLDSINKSKEVFIVEGEMDVLTLMQCGYKNAISVPNGANVNSNKLEFIDSSIQLFDFIDTIYLAVDNDIAGRKLREDLSERFGKEKCKYIEFKDCKDANECLVKYGEKAVLESIKDAKEFPLEGVFRVSDFSDDIDDMYDNGLDRGCALKLGKIDNLLRFVKGYITVITGIPNHGKSDALDEIVLLLSIHHGWKFAFYSPENKPTKLHFSKLARKLIGKNWFGKNKMTEQEKNLCKRFLEDKVYFIKPEKDFTLDSILSAIKDLKKRHGVDAFIIDAWNRLEHKFSGNEGKHINESLLKLDAFCELNNIHCFLVAHPTKMEKDKKTGQFMVPNLYSINGSSHFYNIVANGITIYRDFITNTTKWYIQKVKFSHWGEIGFVEFKYDHECGRYNEVVADICNEDKSNWITNGMTQTEVKYEESRSKSKNKEIILNNDFGDEPPF